MTISVFLDPAQMPNQSQDQLDFDNKMAALMRDLPVFGADVNSTITNLNSIAAGNAYSLPYKIDLSSNVDADPGVGKLRFSSGQGAATAIYIDPIGSDGVNYSALIDSMVSSTSAVKGQLSIVKSGDATKFLMFNITSRLLVTGYYRVVVSPVGSSPSVTPFSNGDDVILKFTAKGDKGDPGTNGTNGSNGAMVLLATATVSSAVQAVNFLSSFSTAYNKYVIQIDAFSSGSGVAVNFRAAYNGVVSANPIYLQSPTVATSLITGINLMKGDPDISYVSMATITIELNGVNQTGPVGSGPSLLFRGVAQYNKGSSTAYLGELSGSGNIQNSAMSGFQLYTAGSFESGSVRVYGIKNVVGA